MIETLWSIAPGHLGATRRAAFDFAPAPRGPVVQTVRANGRAVAIIGLIGVLAKAGGDTSTMQARNAVRSAARDQGVSAIVLHIDSPGGTVAGTADLGADVNDAGTRKPVWAFIEDMGASAAYWIASRAARVYANDSTALVGGVGTVNVMYDLAGAAEKAGVKPLVFGTGPLKGTGTPGAPVTSAHREYLQGLVENAQAGFDDAVRVGRSMTAEQLAGVKRGGLYGATEATSLGLIDGIKTLDQVLTEITARTATESVRQNRSVSAAFAPATTRPAELFPLAGPSAPFAPAAGPVRLDDTRGEIWVHEACHAVVARCLGAQVVQAIVYQAPPVYTMCGFVDHASGPECLTVRAIIAASGPACHALLGYVSGAGSDDRRSVARWASEHEQRTGRPLPVDPYQFARQLLERPEVTAAVNRVTAALRLNVSMTQDQLDRLIAARV